MMDQFKCFICEVTLGRVDEMRVHMDKFHNMKIEEEAITKTIFCALCSYKTRKMNEYKNHMIKDHEKKTHDWWTENIKAEFYCEECECEFTLKPLLISHMDTVHGGDLPTEVKEPVQEDIEVKSEYYVIKNYPDFNNEAEDEEIEKAYGKKKEPEQMGIIMKGKSQTFKDANVVLKSKIEKGKIFKDEKGRQFKILNILEDDTIEVEVKTLSSKPNEKRGQVKLKMYRPNKLRKKDCSIQVMRSSGYSIVFVKAIMKHFIQPIIDAIINEPDNDPMTLYTVKTQDKAM